MHGSPHSDTYLSHKTNDTTITQISISSRILYYYMALVIYIVTYCF